MCSKLCHSVVISAFWEHLNQSHQDALHSLHGEEQGCIRYSLHKSERSPPASVYDENRRGVLEMTRGRKKRSCEIVGTPMSGSCCGTVEISAPDQKTEQKTSSSDSVLASRDV